MSLNIASLLRESARLHPFKTALISPERSLTYAELWDEAQRLAGSLHELGVQPGQHIALLLPNTPTFTVAYFAAQLYGCPVVPLNTMLKTDEIAYHLTDSDAAVLIAGAAMHDDALSAWQRSPQCRHLIACGEGTGPLGERIYRYDELLQRGRAWTEMHPSMPDDTAVIIYTSGTTGKPKGAELTHFNLLYNAEYNIKLKLPMAADAIVGLLVLPLFHSFGQTVLQNALLMAGATIVILPRFEPGTAAAAIAKYQVNYFAGVPTMYFALLHAPEVSPPQLASLRHCVSGGASMPEEVMRRFDATFGVDIIEAYGLSETSPVASFNPLGGTKRIGTIGKPIWGVEFRLVDDQGVDAVAGERGELCIKGPNVMKGYYNRPEATAEALRDGWFHTGDVATCDGDGYYKIVDRKKDLIIRGGFNIYPREIEELLFAHAAVMEAAVVGLPHLSHGEEVHAFVVLRPGASAAPDELVQFCKSRLAAYKYPRHVTILAQLPKGPTGKILKRVLRERPAAG